LPGDEKLWWILEKVDLATQVASLPNGLETIVGERGATLSGGQRHRLALARMFLAQPDVWVLDEPTEHLDAAGAQKVLSSVYENLGTGSLFHITHRMLETVSADHITLLENGAVLESGTPEALEGAGSTYKMLLDRERLANQKTERHSK
jgi:ABC-type transport system involved in cytochrome bd biosynthesis fused ATPase/permease subunit